MSQNYTTMLTVAGKIFGYSKIFLEFSENVDNFVTGLVESYNRAANDFLN